MNQIFKSQNARNLRAYAKEKYGDELEFLWEKFPKNAILRKKKNKKWYAAFCVINKTQLGLQEEGLVEIVNLKLDPQDVLAFVDNKTYFKAWHMNKKHWISILLEGETLSLQELCRFLDESYALA
ncbi:hypothetical protein LS70_006000 [Helicobacter sp. MIT 11-5569]|uniref:MmcQ/YjbR family DNA-binding protein n=1 Tax=Helicobacter sp. MIT 11-5569 TaxID=1548151 RepID=UPI00068F50AA|nr:MmcQ/YjbR family DNA-binding protein [Helicobacter sp. MIT 11-5569]TLD83294.1 hypothetical protein LS70_006000 [Helicobacter sp. MIT 11-5569]